jgi:hypothetical protein
MFELALEAWVLLFPISLYLLWQRHIVSLKTSAVIFRIYLMATAFSLGWELIGTGYAWSYPNFNFYIINNVPIALILGWPFWLTSCFLLREVFLKYLSPSHRTLKRLTVTFLTGIVIGTLVEIIGVALGWWVYLLPLPKNWSIYAFSGYIHIITFIGWGVITVVVLGISDIYTRIHIKIGRFKTLLGLFFLAVFSGIALFYALGILYLALPWSK